MVWFLVDDNLAFHRKAIEAGDAALGLWVRAGSWSAANLTDGYVPSNVARDIGDQYRITRLLNAGLWSRVTGGYQFHDWADYQPTAEQVKQRREAARARKQKQRRHGERSENVTPDVTRDSHARARPSPLKDLGSLPHQGRATAPAPGQAGAAPTKQKKPATDDFAIELEEVYSCRLCDNEGYRGSIVCDHIDRSESYRKGITAAREIINEAKARKANTVDTKSS